MDFIERVFHLSPDGGSGTTEVTCILAMLVVVFGIVLLGRLSRASGRQQKMSSTVSATSR
jgi:hypothetical protein